MACLSGLSTQFLVRVGNLTAAKNPANKTVLTGQGELTGITWVDSAYVK
jgi:hypothetical protein